MDKRNKRRPGNNKRRPPNCRGKKNSKARSPETDDISEPKARGMNDWRWYAANDQILRDAASIPFSQNLGMPVPMKNGGKYDGESYVIPGIMDIRWAPSIGWTDSRTSPANVAATAIYSFVRHANSGSSNYDSPDLMMYLLAMDNIYAGISYLRRIYKLTRVYSYYNRYWPKAMLQTMISDVDDLMQNLADYRLAVNTLTLKACQLAVPNTMPIFLRHSWMSENVYLDASNPKAQAYVFNMDSVLRLDESVNPARLQSVGMPYQWRAILNLVEGCLDKILQSEDFNIMSGDILKAYGANIMKMVTLGEEEICVPIYNEEVLTQIHGLTCYGSDVRNLSVLQDPSLNCLIHKPVIQEDASSTGNNINVYDADCYQQLLLNSRFVDPTPADVMVSTRLMAYLHKVRGPEVSGKTLFDYQVHGGTEIVMRIGLYSLKADGNADGKYTATFMYTSPDDEYDGLLYQTVNLYIPWSNFDWAPLLYHTHVYTTEGQHALLVQGDMSNYTTISKQDLADMHNVALLSEFNIG